MARKLAVFVSSVQKELEDERLIVQNLLNTDSFLASHFTPLLFEFEPAAPDKADEACLAALDGCDAYLLIVGRQYGARAGTVSITHAEYRRAKQRGLPILAFIRGERSVEREAGTRKLLDELDRDGFKYKRFEHVVALQREVRAALVKLAKERFGSPRPATRTRSRSRPSRPRRPSSRSRRCACGGATWISSWRSNCSARSG